MFSPINLIKHTTTSHLDSDCSVKKSTHTKATR